MIKLTSIIGSRVISIYNGVCEGYVVSVVADAKNKKIKALQLADEETETCKILNVKDIFSFNEGFILTRNQSTLHVCAEETGNDTLINKTAVDLNGSSLGPVTEIYLDEHFNTVSFDCGGQEIAFDKIVSIGKNILVINTGSGRVTGSRFKPKAGVKPIAQAEDNRIISINEVSAAILSKPYISAYDQSPAPIKITSSNSYLIGKRISRDCVANNGELIIRKHSIITAKTLKMARHFNKIKELVMFAY